MAVTGIKIGLLNGRAVDPGVRVMPDGVVYGPLSGAGEYSGVLARDVPAQEDGADGFFIIVPDGIDAGPVAVDNNFDAPGIYSTRHIIVVGRDAGLELIYTVEGVDGAEITDNRTAVCGEGSKIRAEDIFGGRGAVAMACTLYQKEGSRSEAVAVAYGSNAKMSVSYKGELRGPYAEAVHAGIFIAADNENVDYKVRVDHLVADCHSDVMVKGVASGNGIGSFTGLVYVAQDAQHTEAYQQSRNLLLSDSAQILTSPQLEIYADDVRCSHGATVGQMDDDAVYFRRQRGLSEDQARGLQLAGFVNDILVCIDDEGRRERQMALAVDKLGIAAQ